MPRDEQSDDGPSPSRFSPELTRDIGTALTEHLLTHRESEETLRTLTNRVCAEARNLGLPPEKMLIEVKHLFEHSPLPDVPDSELRRHAFERFISGCIESYFNASDST